MIETGYPFYGQSIGVLVFSTIIPRIAGDAGNNASFPYPVRYKVISGGFRDAIKGSPELEAEVKKAVLELKELGIRGVVADCGLLSLYQNVIGSLGIPFVGSTLCAIPTLWEMLGRSGKIGVLTGHSELLSPEHLRNSGVREDIGIVIHGLEEEPHFREIVIEGGLEMDPVKMERDVIHASLALQAKDPEVRAIVIECSNLGTFSRAIRDATGLPVLDIITMCDFLERLVHPKLF